MRLPSSLRLALATLGASLALVLAACGGDDAPASRAAATTEGATAGTFPARVRDRFGTTTVASAPKRVVVVGLREQDPLLALGVMPVGTTEWFGEEPGALAAWTRPYVKGRPLPTVLPNADGIDLERVAALRPDLILGIDSAMTREQHATLAKIAPTVGQPVGVGDYGSSWQQELEMTAAALGRPEEGRRLRAEVEGQVRATAARYADVLRGRTGAVVADYQGLYVYGAQDSRTRFLTDLGMRFPAVLAKAAGSAGTSISRERADLLDLDAVVYFPTGRSTTGAFQRDPVLRDRPVVREGRVVSVPEGDPLYLATSKTSVLSLPLLLRELAPRVAAAADGDAGTPTTP